MNKNKNNIINCICKKIFVILLLLFGFIFTGYKVSIQAYSNDDQIESKLICDATIDDNFTDDTILVNLTKEATYRFKEYSKNDFSDLDLLSVSEITKELSLKTEQQLNKTVGLNKSVYNDETNEISNFRSTLILKLTKPSKETVLEYIQILEKRNDIYSVEPNYIGEFTSQTSNDPLRGDQWALNYLQLPDAWGIFTGSNIVRVGIADSGIDRNHPDLSPRINQELSHDFTNANNPWTAGNVHGTHVAGIVGATGNNSIGVVGTNWNTELVSLKVGNNSPTAEAVANAILYANTNNIRIVNLSLNINETTAINNAINSFNGVIICAAGNNGNSNVGYPARVNNPRIISVGSLDSNSGRSSFSNWGKVDIWAPGGNILSTIPFGDTPSGFRRHSNGYAYADGTSMAAPYVSGIAALLLSINFNLSIQQLRDAIIDTSNTIDITHPSGLLGLGRTTISVRRLNAYNAIKSVLSSSYDYEYVLSSSSTTKQINKSISSGTLLFNRKNGFYKLEVTYSKHYEFIISSDKLVNIKLYDNNFTELSISDLNSTDQIINIDKYLSVGTYYIRVYYPNVNDYGSILTKIMGVHAHYYGEPYLWRNNRQHFATCECGHTQLQGHAVSSSWNGIGTTTCLLCGGPAEMGFVQWTRAINNPIITQNGSYILPNGVMVIVDNDLDAFLNGTLLFGTNGSYTSSYDDFMEQNTFSDILVISNNNIYYYKDESDTTPFIFDYSKKNQYQLDARN